MTRWMYALAEVDGLAAQAAAVFRDRGGELLRRAAGARPPAGEGSEASSPPAVDAEVAGVPLETVVELLIGPAVERDGSLLLAVRWQAEPSGHAFPAFDGELELKPLGRDRSRLTLVGRGRGPEETLAGGGRDPHTVADRAMQRLVNAVATELGHAIAGSRRAHGHGVEGELQVRDLMTTDPLVLEEDLPLRTAALLLFHYGVSGAPVITADGELVGVLSEADLLPKEGLPRWGVGRRARQEYRRRTAKTVGDACSRPALVTHPDVRLNEAVRQILDHDVARLVVVDDSAVVGMLTRHDVLRALTRADSELQAAVELELDEHGARDVHALVEFGVVTLAGRAPTRSLAGRLPRRIAGIDGVSSVTGELSWLEDDTTPLPGSPPARP